jgi:hypothetical protein
MERIGLVICKADGKLDDRAYVSFGRWLRWKIPAGPPPGEGVSHGLMERACT